MSLVVLVILGLIIRWRRKRGGDQPPPLPPHTQEVSKYSKPQPTSPVLDPIGADPPHNPHYVRSPFFFVFSPLSDILFR